MITRKLLTFQSEDQVPIHYKCKICLDICRNPILDINHNDGTIQCDIRADNLIKHVNSYVLSLIKIGCKYCGKHIKYMHYKNHYSLCEDFIHKDHLMDHFIEIDANDQLKCHFCKQLPFNPRIISNQLICIFCLFQNSLENVLHELPKIGQSQQIVCKYCNIMVNISNSFKHYKRCCTNKLDIPKERQILLKNVYQDKYFTKSCRAKQTSFESATYTCEQSIFYKEENKSGKLIQFIGHEVQSNDFIEIIYSMIKILKIKYLFYRYIMNNIKFKFNGYNYLCLKCQDFPKQPQMCQVCRGVLCLKCLSIYEKCARCNGKFFSPMLMSLQYIYDKSSINCEICNLEQPLRKIQKHQQICQKQQNWDIDFSLQQKYHQSKMFDKDYNRMNFVEISEENVIDLQNMQLDCILCQQKLNCLQMLNHFKQCELYKVDCQCKQKYQRYQFSEHIQSCFAIQFQQKQTELSIIQQIINSSKQNIQICEIEQFNDDIAYIVDDIYDDIQQTNYSDSNEDDSDSYDSDQ